MKDTKIRAPLQLTPLLVGMILMAGGQEARADVTTLTLVDGWNANNGAVMSSVNQVTMLNTDDNQFDVFAGLGLIMADNKWLAPYFESFTLPTDHTLASVVVKFERNMDAGIAGTLRVDVSDAKTTTLWSNGTGGDETGEDVNFQDFVIPAD